MANMITQNQLQTRQYVQSALASISSSQAPTSAPPPPPPIPAQPVVQSAATHAHRPTVKLNPPRVFNGKAEEVELFLGECEAHIKFYMVDFPSDDHKILFAASYLKDGNPQNWYLGLQRTNSAEVHDWDLFKRSLRTHFVTYDVAARAYDKLRALKQTGSAAAHVARFNELVVDVDISETNRFTLFKEGLKYELRERIMHIPRNISFKEYCERVIEIDNEMHDLKMSTNKTGSKQSTTNRYPPRQYSNQPQASTSQTVPAGEPMQIDATKTKYHAPLTADEKARRLSLKLCLYCGGANHTADKCPNKSQKAKTRDAKRSNSASGKV